jgi:hypothetical protein
MNTPILTKTIQHRGVKHRVWLYREHDQFFIASVKPGGITPDSGDGNEAYLDNIYRDGGFKLVYYDEDSRVPISRLHALLTAAKLLQ